MHGVDVDKLKSHTPESVTRQHLLEAGVHETQLASAEKLGLDWQQLFQLLVKYGPVVLAIIQDIIALKAP